MKSQTVVHVSRLSLMYRESLKIRREIGQFCSVSLVQMIVEHQLLMKHTPNAIGGEMEGWVLLELKRTLKGLHNKDIEVIVVKGVADYGDLSKGDQWQWTAAKAAMDCIHYCLDKSGGIEFSGER